MSDTNKYKTHIATAKDAIKEDWKCFVYDRVGEEENGENPMSTERQKVN